MGTMRGRWGTDFQKSGGWRGKRSLEMWRCGDEGINATPGNWRVSRIKDRQFTRDCEDKCVILFIDPFVRLWVEFERSELKRRFDFMRWICTSGYVRWSVWGKMHTLGLREHEFFWCGFTD